jgi:hypothetical protein
MSSTSRYTIPKHLSCTLCSRPCIGQVAGYELGKGCSWLLARPLLLVAAVAVRPLCGKARDA